MDTVELSVEETNKLREKLGLKPLRVTNTATQNKKHEKAKEEGEGEGTPSVSVKEKLLAMRQDRLAAASAKKEAEEKARVVTLGTKQSEDDDDMKAWIQKSRKLEKEKAKALKTQQALLQQEEFDGGDAAAAAAAAGGGGGGGGGNGNGNGNRKRRRGGGKGNSSYNAQSLGGLKIGHKADDFQQGTQVVLTLKDQGVLDDCGELQTGEDVLEDTLLAQQEKQAEALERSKPKSRYEEEEEEDKKTVLAKYDDPKKASTSTYMEIDASGQVDKAQLEAQAEMSRKLKQGIHYGKLKESADPMKRALDDFWTPEELTSMQQEKGGGKGKGKKRRRKKNKNIRMKKKDIDDLEAQAQAEEEAAGAEDKNKTHHGKRVQGMKTKQTQESYLNEQARRDAAYSEALSKAAEKTAAMVESTQQMQTDQATLENFEEEEDNEFFSALTRARESALSRQRKADVSTALQQAKNLSKEDASTSLYRGEIFTEASEFCNSISAKDHESTTPAEKQEGLLPGEKSQDKVKEENTQQEQQSTSASGSASKVATNAPAAAVLGEARIDKGIGAALRMLQDRGELRKTVRWSGRTNDMRDNNVRDVIESYNDETQFAQDIESALTRKDEFGRVMTPKEAFRQLCYKFHGIKASKNKQEKRIKKYLEEQKILQKNNTK